MLEEAADLALAGQAANCLYTSGAQWPIIGSMKANLSSSTFTTFGEMLHYLRRQAQLTQRELAIAAGYSESMISRLEHDERPPDVATLQALFAPALGVQDQPEVMAQLIALAQQARGEQSTASQPTAGQLRPLLPRRRLPVRLTSFVGREAEVRAVAQLLTKIRLVTLTGPGGCGKTSLAVETARWLSSNTAATGAEQAAEGSLAYAEICLVELLPLRDPGLLAQTILEALSLESSPLQTPLQTLLGTVGNRSVLLILDNCEHLIDAVACLAPALLQECPHLRVLVTSRERLNIAAETIYSVAPLACPDVQRLPALARLTGFAAIQLFVDRCQAVMPSFRLTEQTAPAVTQVCTLLDGIPLALELGAAAIATFSVQEVAGRLKTHLLPASPSARAADPRHLSIADAVAWSYQLLPPAEQRLLAQLSVFSGGWTVEAMQQVCAIQADCTAVLHQLTQKSLIQVEPGPPLRNGTRYHLLRAVREYVAAQLAASGEEECVCRRHFDYFARLGAALGQQVFGPDHAAALTALDADHANIRAALSYGRGKASLVEPYVRLAAALPFYWRLRGYVGESVSWLDKTLQEQAELSPVTQALAHAAILSELSGAHYWCPQRLDDDVKLACELARADALIETCLEQGKDAAAAWLMLMVAGVREDKGDGAWAADYARRAWRIFSKCGEVGNAGLACVQLNRALLAQGNLQEAARLHRETAGFLDHNRLHYLLCESYTVHLAVARAEADRAGMIYDLTRLAEIAEQMELSLVLHDAYCDLEAVDRELACRMAEACLARQQQRSPSVMLALAAHQLGRIHLNAGRYAQAQRCLDEAIQLWQLIPIPARESLGAQWSLIDRGEVAWFQDERALAIACFDESIRLFNASPYPAFSMYPLLYRGYVRLAEGELDRALDDFRASLRMERLLPEGWSHCIIYFLAAAGEVAHRRGDLAAAGRLMAASTVLEASWHAVATFGQPHEIAHYDSIMENIPQYREYPSFEAGWQAGKALSVDEVIALALES